MSVISRLAEETGKSEGFVQAWADERGIVLRSMLSCSKGSRGLFVPSRVIGIFTDTTISLSSRLRQCPDHYTIRAGRNLPDKEFRYLRTVIVTAAVYWGFNSMLLLR